MLAEIFVLNDACVSSRYSGWFVEAERTNEAAWLERLESESVQSLSRSFYKSFASGKCVRTTAGRENSLKCNHTVRCSATVGSITVGGNISRRSCNRPDFENGSASNDANNTFSRWKNQPVGSASVGNEDEWIMDELQTMGSAHVPLNLSGDDESSGTVQQPTVCARRGVFNLSRAFRSLRLYSSVRTVLPPSSDAIPPAVPKTPVPPPGAAFRDSRGRPHRRRLRQATASVSRVLSSDVPEQKPNGDDKGYPTAHEGVAAGTTSNVGEGVSTTSAARGTEPSSLSGRGSQKTALSSVQGALVSPCSYYQPALSHVKPNTTTTREQTASKARTREATDLPQPH